MPGLVPATSPQTVSSRPDQTPAPVVPVAPARSATPPAPQRPPRPAARAPRTARAVKGEPEPMRWLDVGGASILVLVAAAAVAMELTGPLRFLATLPMILFVPGYLLLQAVAVPAARGKELAWQAVASLGLSPALLGLFALATAIVEGGFRLGIIVGLSTILSLGLATVALVRRRAVSRPTKDAAGASPVRPAPAVIPGAPPVDVRSNTGTLRP